MDMAYYNVMSEVLRGYLSNEASSSLQSLGKNMKKRQLARQRLSSLPLH
jgi:hypothetical protein